MNKYEKVVNQYYLFEDEPMMLHVWTVDATPEESMILALKYGNHKFRHKFIAADAGGLPDFAFVSNGMNALITSGNVFRRATMDIYHLFDHQNDK
jgi:hypothetical protein